ncbi:MAG: T9SS type A sorting domain-containing protein [Bacteroidales bacterium]|jgi:hypothetical protein|nr:T9SS type A sorting domain-containing protein [Bacteroidales bacterium]
MKIKSLLIFFLATSFLVSNVNFAQAQAKSQAQAQAKSQAQAKTQTKGAQSSISQRLGQIVPKTAQLQTPQSATHQQKPVAKLLSPDTLNSVITGNTPIPITIPFHDTVTITFDTASFSFYDEYGQQHFGVPFSLTLDEDALLSFSSTTKYSGIKPYFRFLSATTGEECALTGEVPVILFAGSYILIIEDGSANLAISDRYLTAEVQIDKIPFTDIPLPCNNSFTQTLDNTFDCWGYRWTAFRVTVPSDKVFNLTSTYSEDTLISMVEIDILKVPSSMNLATVANESSIPLSAGTYFVFVCVIGGEAGYYWDYHTSLDITLSISENTTAQIIPISPIPSEKEFLMTEDNMVQCFGYDVLLYSFTLEDTTALEIAGSASVDVAFFLYSDKLMPLAEGYPDLSIATNLVPGTYFLAVVDYLRMIRSEELSSISGVINISVLTMYPKLDFSKNLNVGEEQWGDAATMDRVLFAEGWDPWITAAYHFNAEAGHSYKISWDIYSLTAPITVFGAVLKTPATGNLDLDVIESGVAFSETTFGQGYIIYFPSSSAVVNFILMSETPQEGIMYRIVLEDTNINVVAEEETKEFSWVDITLPFASHLYFDTNHNTLAINDGGIDKYLKCFRLVLNERTRLDFVSGHEAYFSALMNIYRDTAMTDCVSGYGLWQGDNIVLEAGTWYVVFSDDGFRWWYRTWASCLVWVSGTTDFKEPPTILSLREVLDSPSLPVVNYGDTFADAGYFLEDITPLVAGDYSVNFQYEGDAFYVVAYKLVGMTTDSTVNIDVLAANEEAVIYVYKKDPVSGEYLHVADCYDEDHFVFTASEDIDYYIVVSPESSYKYIAELCSYSVSIYSNQKPDVPEPAVPDNYLITSTSTDVTVLGFSASATEMEIRVALAALTVTATTKDSQEISLLNDPYAWTITSTPVPQAQFATVPAPYQLTLDYTPATVGLSFRVNIEDKNDNKKLYLYTSNDRVNVCGLDGTEQLYLYNISGKMISKVRAASQVQQFDIGNLPHSMYIVLVQKENKLTSLKFIK